MESLLLFVCETNLTMLNVTSMKVLTQTCRAIFSPSTHLHLRGYLLKFKVLSIFTKRWILSASKEFAILPPQEVLLGILRPLLPTCSIISNTIHSLYNHELTIDPHLGHPMRSIRILHGRHCFPRWTLLGPVVRANRGNSPFNTEHYWSGVRDIINGRHTWWLDWPCNHERIWPLALGHRELGNLIYLDTRLEF
jgi:hypothetical protein